MKLLNYLSRPYMEYCIRTNLSEDELKEIFQKEFPLYNNTFALAKEMFNWKQITFFRSADPFHVITYQNIRNSVSAELQIKCQKDEYSPETILHISIVPRGDVKALIALFFGFCLIFCAVAIWHGKWQVCIPALLLPLFGWIVLSMIRVNGENETPKIRQAFELKMRDLEEKYKRNRT